MSRNVPSRSTAATIGRRSRSHRSASPWNPLPPLGSAAARYAASSARQSSAIGASLADSAGAADRRAEAFGGGDHVGTEAPAGASGHPPERTAHAHRGDDIALLVDHRRAHRRHAGLALLDTGDPPV